MLCQRFSSTAWGFKQWSLPVRQRQWHQRAPQWEIQNQRSDPTRDREGTERLQGKRETNDSQLLPEPRV